MAERLLLPTTVYNVLASKVPPKRAARWPQEASKTLPERLIAKVLILTPVVVVVVVGFAFYFLVVIPVVLPCSSRERRPTTPDNHI